MNKIIDEVENNILQNFPILREDVGMSQDIYVPSVPYFQVKTFHHKFQYVDPIAVPNAPKVILDKYNNFALLFDIMHINNIVLPNTTYQHILFATVSMIKNRKLRNI